MKMITKSAQIKDTMHLLSFKNFMIHYFKKKKTLRHAMRGIKSKDHNLGTYEINKISLSCFDDKRYILKNGIYTLAYGHKDIPKKINLKHNKSKKYFFL